MIAVDFADLASGHLLGHTHRAAHLFNPLAGATNNTFNLHFFVFPLVLDTFLLVGLSILLFSFGFASYLIQLCQFEPSVHFFFKFLVLGCRD